MANENGAQYIASQVEKLEIRATKDIEEFSSKSADNEEYGLPLNEVYKLALNFYKEKGGKAVHFSYEDTLQLIAFFQQVSHGPLANCISKLQPLGTLDMVGKDRRDAWQKLGQLSEDQARLGFVNLLSRRCPLFITFVEAHRREKEELERKQTQDNDKKMQMKEEQRIHEENEKQIIEEMQKEEAIKRQIQQALNEQTYDQFRIYAEQQYRGDPEKQGTLIRQLQEQHYIQYMQQLALAQKHTVQSQIEIEDQIQDLNSNEIIIEGSNTNEFVKESESVKALSDRGESTDEYQTVCSASMWTLPDIEGFKQKVSQTEGDGVVRVGHGETVTVRVPTHPHGSRLFWEFATDHYDIGFGIYFEFCNPTTEEVSVHVSESDAEEDLDDGDEDDLYIDEVLKHDLEAGAVDLSSLKEKPLLTEIVPVYRRDCQTEVYAGSHQYPGKGVYLLKFDNSYSLWRSKTLYYRVYYTH